MDILSFNWKTKKRKLIYCFVSRPFQRLIGLLKPRQSIANSFVVLLKAFNDEWGYSVTHPTHEKHFGSGSEGPMPAWQHSVVQPQWTFSGYRDHYSLSY